jgi:hypothetical protein
MSQGPKGEKRPADVIGNAVYLWRNAMMDDTGDFAKIDEDLVTYDLSDETLEAAAGVDDGRAITFVYCATAASAWYCLPF